MFSQTYYVVRSQGTGQYLVAHPESDATKGYLLLFAADYDALSYVNAHTQGTRPSCQVEGMASTAIRATLERWELNGVGFVADPLLPEIQFFQIEKGLPFA